MVKPVLQLAAAGVIGVVVWKVLSFLLLPLLGTFLGFLFTIVKVALIVGLVFLAIWFIRKRGDSSRPSETGQAGEAPAE